MFTLARWELNVTILYFLCDRAMLSLHNRQYVSTLSNKKKKDKTCLVAYDVTWYYEASLYMDVGTIFSDTCYKSSGFSISMLNMRISIIVWKVLKDIFSIWMSRGTFSRRESFITRRLTWRFKSRQSILES